MSDLLSPTRRQRPQPGTTGAQGRPLAVTAVLAGGVAAGSVLVACMAVGLVGWFASDAGAHGTTRDALRVGADAWLLAHGAHLDLTVAAITAAPLGITALCLYVAFRLGRWAGMTSVGDDVRTVLLGALAMAGVYGATAVVTAVLASTPEAQPHLGLAFVGGFAVAFAGGGLGLTSGTGLLAVARDRLPQTPVAVVTGALGTVLLVFAASAVLLAISLLTDLGTAATVLSRLHADTSGDLLYTLVVAAVAPNAVLLTSSYLLGPGFAVGVGTVVSPSAVLLGPVPAFPLLAALPADGPTPAWTTALVALPVLLAAVAALLMVRRFPVPSYELGALRGLLSGVLGGVALAVLVLAAGGAVGPGRMADVGAPVVDTLLAAVASTGVGGLAGGVLATWRLRRSLPVETDRRGAATRSGSTGPGR
jgi:hypothetical protein